MTPQATVIVRPFRPEDAPRLLEAVARTFREYGMRLDLDGFDRDVRDPLGRYGGADAAFFTAEADGAAAGFAGVDLPRPGVAELHRLYIDPAARGRGLGARLCAAVEAWARGRALGAVELWSDVRFAHAHRLYAGRGYRLFGQRVLADLDRSVEYGFRRDLAAPARAEAHGPEGARAVPLAEVEADPDLAHRARMVAAAILDPRALVRAGRMDGGGHALPDPREVLGGPPGCLVLDGRPGPIVIGFERERAGAPAERRLHPLFTE